MERTKDIMTKELITVGPSDSMAHAYELMHTWNIRHLPVIDERMKVIGILSERDVQRSMDVEKISTFQQSVSISSDKKVEDFMSWPVYSVSDSTSIEKVAEEMLAQKISAFMVCDERGQNKGIVTTDDLLSFLLTVLKEQKQTHFKPMADCFLNRAVG